jgi:hypothetical protein
VTAQQCGILDRQTYTHRDCTFHGHMIKNYLAWSAVYFMRTLYKHFTVTLQRNVGGGDVWQEWDGGVAGSPGPIQDFKHVFDKGWLCCLPHHAFSARVTHFIFTGMRVVGVFDGDSSLGGGGHACPPSPLTDRSSPARTEHKEHWPGSRTCPIRRARLHPPHLNR